MKQMAFFVFLTIILSVHFGVNLYIYFRGIQGLEAWPVVKACFRWGVIFFMLAYPIGRFLEKVWLSPVSDVFHWAGALWFAVMLYAFLLLLPIDLVRLANRLFHFLPQIGSPEYLRLKLIVTGMVVSAVVLIVGGGFLNAWHPKVSYMTLHIPKNGGEFERLRIVAASDVHMGTIIAKRKIDKLVDTIHGLDPDLILFAGDVVDEDVQPVIRQNLGRSLLRLKAPLGVYAITGNHEHIGGVSRTVEYLSSHGLTFLRDTAILVHNSFYIVGREDRDVRRSSGRDRRSMEELMHHVDRSKPVILLDHQPYNLQEAVEAGVDLQLSGHTHHGQLWPFGYVTQRIFEVSRGYLKRAETHFYVSTGFGTWGPPVRTGNRPEIVVFDLVFDK
ncbi:MAG: metallophosphoesterase [Breznakibacter sp.]